MNWRRWLFWLIVLAFLIFLFSRRLELEELWRVLREGQWQWLLVGIIFQMAYFFLYAFLFQQAFSRVEVKSRWQELLPVIFASIFVNTITPTAGFGGAALFIDDAVQRGESAARAAEGLVLTEVAEHFLTIPFIAVGLTYLSTHHALYIYEIIGIIFYFIYILILTTVLLLGHIRPQYLKKILGWVQQKVNFLSFRFRRRALLYSDWASKNTRELKAASDALVVRPAGLIPLVLVSLAQQVVNLASLWFIFLAFGLRINLGALLAGYAIGFVFAVISVLPYDIGLMQVVLILAYESLGVPASTALIAILAYGGINAWLPILTGFFTLRSIRSFRRPSSKDRKPPSGNGGLTD